MKYVSSFAAKIYAFRFLDEFILIYPLYVVMFSDKGVSPFDIAVLLIVWSLTAFILEVPSGVLADKYPRKNILVIAQLIRALGYVIWLVMPNFTGFLIGFILWGIKSALTSGTFEALVYDELKQSAQQRRYAKTIGRATAVSMVAMSLAGIGAYLVSFRDEGYEVLLLLSITSVIVSALTILRLPTVKMVHSTEEFRYISHLKQGLKLVRHNRMILRLLVFASLGLSVGAIDEYYSLFFKELGLNNPQISLWDAIWSGTAVVGGVVAYRFERIGRLSLGIMIIALGGILSLAGFAPSPFAMILISVFTLLYQVIDVVFDTRLQHAIEDRTRATVSSMQGFLSEAGALASFLLFGCIAQLYSNAVAITCFGVIIVIGAVLFVSSSLKRRNSHSR